MTNDYHTKFDSRYVTSSDGTKIYTDAVGNRSASAPVIVFIHGAGMVKGSFNSIFEDPGWTTQAFLVRYDARGHGKSGKPLTDEGWESRRIWEDFEAVCREFNVTATYILGWSLGSGHFVDIMTYNTSITICGLINVAGPVVLDPALNSRAGRPELFEVLEALSNPPSVDDFQEAIFRFIDFCSKKLSPDLVRILIEGIILQPRKVAAIMNSRKHNPEIMFQRARAGELKLLAIGGGKDRTWNVEGFRSVLEETGWKGYTFKLLEEADHMPWVSVPEDFRDVVMGWVLKQGSD